MSLNNTLFLLASFHKTILNDINNNITNNDTLPFVSKENENEGYLYLLVIDLLFFFH